MKENIIYYIIYCGAMVGGFQYANRIAAEKAAKLYSKVSGCEWRVRMMVGGVAHD